MQKSLKKNEEQKMFEEDVYRSQIKRTHGHLGRDHVDKYDTGKEK